MELRVAGAQLAVSRDIDANAEAIERGIAFAESEGADILLTPEGSLSGYTHQFDRIAATAALEQVTATAKAAGVGLALGTCFVEPEDARCYNQVRFYEPSGDYLGFHSKTLTCGSMEDEPKGEIEHYAISPLRTFDFAGATVGGLICNDLWANPQCTPIPDPHLSQQLTKMGAKVIFHAIFGGRSASDGSDIAWRFHESNLRMRAAAGGVWIVTADSATPTDVRVSCPSGVVDPRGNWACRAPSMGEQFFAHTIPLD